MFKLIFRTISLIVILFILIIVLIIWKGGKPFRWIGGKTVSAGRSIERFGDAVDKMEKVKKEVGEALNSIKELIDLRKNKGDEESEKDAAVNKRKRTE